MKVLGQLHHFLGVTVEPVRLVFSFTSASTSWISWSLPG
jgi:hypothetical protein